MSDFHTIQKLTFEGLAEEIDCRGVKACMVCETPVANMNSSLSSELVLPRAFWWRGKIKIVLVSQNMSKVS